MLELLFLGYSYYWRYCSYPNTHTGININLFKWIFKSIFNSRILLILMAISTNKIQICIKINLVSNKKNLSGAMFDT